MTTTARKTAPRGQIPSYCEFATYRMLLRALRDYRAHFHHERKHQGLGNVLITPQAFSADRAGPVVRRPRLGGLLNYYERAAA